RRSTCPPTPRCRSPRSPSPAGPAGMQTGAEKGAALMTVALMWEAKAAEGRGSELLEWAHKRLPEGPVRRELLTAPGERVLAITWWDAEEDAELPELPEPPGELIARPVHRWRFTSVHVSA